MATAKEKTSLKSKRLAAPLSGMPPKPPTPKKNEPKKKKEASAASAAEEPEIDDEEAMAAQLMKEVCMPHPCLFSSPGCDSPRLLFHFLCLRQCLGPQARTKSHQRR